MPQKMEVGSLFMSRAHLFRAGVSCSASLLSCISDTTAATSFLMRLASRTLATAARWPASSTARVRLSIALTIRSACGFGNSIFFGL